MSDEWFIFVMGFAVGGSFMLWASIIGGWLGARAGRRAASGTSKGEGESKSRANGDNIDGPRIKITPELRDRAVAVQETDE